MTDHSRQRWRRLSEVARRLSILLPLARRAVRVSTWINVALGKLVWTARIQHERYRRSLGGSDCAIDLRNDVQVARAVGMPWASIYWHSVGSDEVVDRWSAARFCIDLWRGCGRMPARFPLTTRSDETSFASWVRQELLSEATLSAQAKEHVLALLESDPAARARQFFFHNPLPRAALPQGLLPPGMTMLLRWFFRHGTTRGRLRLEEVWWLFLQAAGDPQRELALAYLFTPTWQALHPDGLTVFGREAFATWFSARHGIESRWLDTGAWPEQGSPAAQIRLAYWARPPWQRAHPEALTTAEGARALIAWLASPQGTLPQAQRAWCEALDVEAVVAEILTLGSNVIAHFCYPSGLRVSAESLVEAMNAEGIGSSLRDARTDIGDEARHMQFCGMESHDVTIIHVQPEPFFDSAYERADLWARRPGTYRIAYWYWEFDVIPDTWVQHADQVDEVWAATEFVARGLREKLSVPVHTVFPGVHLKPFVPRDRSHFGLKGSDYTFLFTFHMTSVMERKNPLGLIRAFRQAFRSDEPVQLVLKTSFGHRYPQQFQALRDAAVGANIVIIDEIYDAQEILALIDTCDTYVSLHRSEGLGLTMAEAMLLGKPVIATRYSGNVDFMNEDNSLLVPYELVTLGRPIPPYGSGLRWAEPSHEHATQLMRRVYENPAWAREVGVRARASAQSTMSASAAGQRVRQRLEEIRKKRTQAHKVANA